MSHFLVLWSRKNLHDCFHDSVDDDKFVDAFNTVLDELVVSNSYEDQIVHVQ